ncbi:MAG TPA: discoidin domain-containing protein, partial [Saprospiraceae bacterium]|nr:discoidin domain-containing protein [Saprospiraceae bacterium]
YGWQRFGEHLDNTFLDPFIEGAWMTQYGNRYYLQYGAPGTEFSGYADGVLVGPGPLGPFTPQSDPLSSKPGGFIHGAGHGSTFQDAWGNYWHTSTLAISVKNNFERRIGLWPAGFDADSVMYCNTAFGDYPHYLPAGPADHLQSRFTGWMLLNYQKPVQASSALPGHPANLAVDENVKTWWAAASNQPGEWFQTDLGDTCTVYAIQVNHADQGVDVMGKSEGVYYRYKLWHSLDGKKWRLLSDRSQPGADAPHDYLELPRPLRTRFIRIEFSGQRTGAFALSGLRVFGRGDGAPPPAVRELIVLRTEKDPRSAWLKWRPVDEAWAYNLYYGTAPDKLYNCIMVHDANEYWFKGMDARKTYYFSIEAVNENGVSERSGVVEKAP